MKFKLLIIAILLSGVLRAQNYTEVTNIRKYKIELHGDSTGKKFWTVIFPGGEYYGIYNGAGYRVKKFWVFDSAVALIRTERIRRWQEYRKYRATHLKPTHL